MLLVELSGFDNHTDEAAFFCTTNAENNFASCGSKQGVIAANTNILTRIERSTTLTHEDGTGADEFTTDVWTWNRVRCGWNRLLFCVP